MFKVGDIFLSKSDKQRITLQNFHENLYLSKNVYDKKVRVTGSDGKIQNVVVNQLLPLPATISETWSDLLFLEFPKISYEDDAADELIKPVIDDMQIQLLEGAGSNSAIGMLWWLMFKVDGEVKYKFIQPQKTLWTKNELGELINFKMFKDITNDDKSANKIYKVIEHAYLHDDENKIIVRDDKKIHMLFEYTVVVNSQGEVITVNEESAESTNLSFIPVVEVLNMGLLGSDVGRSDYQGKEDLFQEIDKRFAQINYVIDENADPWKLVPAGILDEQGHFNKSNGKMIEKAATGAQDNSIDIVTWDGNLASAFEAIKAMMRQLFFTSRISPSIAGLEDGGGGVESGRALKWRSVNTLSALGKRRLYWTVSIKKFFKFLSEMDPKYSSLKDKNIVISWQDGLPIDTSERTENIVQQVSAGIKSRFTAIQDINEYDDEQTQAEINRIDADEKQAAETEAASNGPIIV